MLKVKERVNHLLSLLNKQTKSHQKPPNKWRTAIKTNGPRKKKSDSLFGCLSIPRNQNMDWQHAVSFLNVLSPQIPFSKKWEKKLSQQQRASRKHSKPLLHYGNSSSSTCLAGLGNSGLQIGSFQCFPSLHHNLTTNPKSLFCSFCLPVYLQYSVQGAITRQFLIYGLERGTLIWAKDWLWSLVKMGSFTYLFERAHCELFQFWFLFDKQTLCKWSEKTRVNVISSELLEKLNGLNLDTHFTLTCSHFPFLSSFCLIAFTYRLTPTHFSVTFRTACVILVFILLIV